MSNYLCEYNPFVFYMTISYLLICDFSSAWINFEDEHNCNFGGLKCPVNLTCVTYERDCGRGAMCPLSVEGLKTYECFSSHNSAGVPQLQLCDEDEIFVRGYLITCSELPCPPHWTYKCYPKTIYTPTCENRKCPAKTECVIEERCKGEYCYPTQSCAIKFC